MPRYTILVREIDSSNDSTNRHEVSDPKKSLIQLTVDMPEHCFQHIKQSIAEAMLGSVED